MSSKRKIKSRINKRRARSFQALAAKARMVSEAGASSAESPMLTKLLIAYGDQAREANEVLADQISEQLQQSLSDILDEMSSVEEEVKKVSGRVLKANKVVPGSTQDKQSSTYNNRAGQKQLPSSSRRKGGKNLFTKIGRGLTGAAEKIAGVVDEDVEYAINSDPLLLALASLGKVSRKIGVFMSGKKKGFQPERDRRAEAKEKLKGVESSREAQKQKADCPSYEEVKQAMRESLAEYFAQNPIKQESGSLLGDVISSKVTDKLLKALGGAGAGLGSLLGKGIDKVKGTLGGAAKTAGGLLDKVTAGKGTSVLGSIGKYAGAAAKGVAKVGARVLPFAGAAVGGGSAVLREMEGDHVGAGIDAAAAAASFVPVFGTAIAGGLVGVNMVRDYFNEDAAKNNEGSQDKRTSVGKIYEDKSGKPKLDTVKSALDTVSKEFGIDRAEIYAVARQESSFNPNANKGNDKDAKGLFQFVKSTWNDLIKKFPELQEKYGINTIVGDQDDRYNPMKSAIMYAYLRKEDIRAIGNITSGNSATDSYLTHFLGAPTAKKVLGALKESPNTSIRAYLSDRAYEMNRASFDTNGRPKTVKEFVDYVDSLMKSRIQKEQAEIAKVPPQITSMVESSNAAPAPVVQSASTDALKVQPGVDIEGLDSNFKSAIAGAAAEYKDKTGKNVQVNSGYRSVEKQAELYKKDPSKAAKPGSSLHNYGLAIDINSSDANAMASMDILDKYGLERPLLHGKGRIKPEPWHIQPVGAVKPKTPDSGPSENVASTGAIKDVSSRIAEAPVSEPAPQVVVLPQPAQQQQPQSPPNSRVPPSRSTPSSIQTAQAAENRRVL